MDNYQCYWFVGLIGNDQNGSCCPFQEVHSVYRILAGILNIGNIEFAAISSQHQTDKSEVPNAEALENGNCLMSVHCVIKMHVSLTLVVSKDAVKYSAAVAGPSAGSGCFY